MRTNTFRMSYLLLGGLLFFTCCANGKKQGTSEAHETEVLVSAPAFDADSAYHFVEAQTAFGPRVPNTEAHRRCADFLATKLESLGAKVVRQHADVIAFDGTVLHAQNIIGSYQPEKQARILLCAHWDSRPFADQDNQQREKAIDGANDGASGVGVLLEIARHLQQKAPEVGVDIAFFDAEDYGMPSDYNGTYQEDSWCLGTQYWGRIPHVPDYKARFGILLDMVGGKGATFYQEAYSMQTAGNVVKRIWKTADKIGHGSYFIPKIGGQVTDDHLYVNRLRQIPCVDIIDLNPQSETGFNPTWHTHQDNLQNIDKNTLKAVGQTVLTVIYNEK